MMSENEVNKLSVALNSFQDSFKSYVTFLFSEWRIMAMILITAMKF